MAEFDPEAIVLQTVRQQIGKDSAGLKSRFAEDLGLSDEGRRSLFAYMVETFTAKGQNLPSRGFYLSDFLECKTVGDALDAIKSTLAGTRKAARAGTRPAAAKAPAPAASASASTAPTATRPPTPSVTSAPQSSTSKPSKGGAKKKAAGARKSSKRR